MGCVVLLIPAGAFPSAAKSFFGTTDEGLLQSAGPGFIKTTKFYPLKDAPRDEVTPSLRVRIFAEEVNELHASA